MKVHERAPVLDEILEGHRASLGSDYAAYTNHCYRVLNFCLTHGGDADTVVSKASVAVAFHDLGIWASDTFDYLDPSKDLARAYLSGAKREGWTVEVEAMIEHHHQIRGYRGNAGWLVEPFRRADWTDVSKGTLRFGLPSRFVTKVVSTFPNYGFHRKLAELTWRRFKEHPLSPLPMLRL